MDGKLNEREWAVQGQRSVHEDDATSHDIFSTLWILHFTNGKRLPKAEFSLTSSLL